MDRLILKVVAFFVIVNMFACEPTSSEDESIFPGTFKGKVGDTPNNGLYEELEGQATFNYDNSDSTFNFRMESDLVSDVATTKIFFRMKSLDVLEIGSYNINNIESLSEINDSGFSGFYYSPTVGLSKQYYSESGSLTISSKDSYGRLKGFFEAVIFYKAITDTVSYTKSYTKISGEFFADPEIMR